MRATDRPTQPRRPTQESVWPVGRVAAMLGIPAVTLRSWEIRYGIEPSHRSPGRHRRYSRDDIERLRRMQRLMTAGTPPREAARLSRSDPPGVRPDQAEVAADADAQTRRLLAAAEAFRMSSVASVLDECFAYRGVQHGWQQVIAPALRQLDERFRRTGDCTDIETGLAQAAAEAVDRYVGRHGLRNDGTNPVLLVCCPHERHQLPLRVLQAVLLERGLPAVLLGPDVPADAVRRAARRTTPRAVLLWSVLERPGQDELRHRLQREGVPACAAGPGWPADAGALETLDAALDRLAQFRPF
jgi:DNA-binding transcriptional MerR regulator